MRVALVIFVLVVGESYATNFVVVAPNVMHYDVAETVSVSLQGQAEQTVRVSLKDWPDKKNEFSVETKTFKGHSAAFRMKVSPGNFPNTERLKEGDRRYVFLVAKVGNVEKTSVVLVSGKNGMVYVQTDKPIYTPEQKVSVRVYTTDFTSVPTTLPIRLDIVTPQGIIVDRKEGNSNEQGVKGYMAHDFEIDIRPITGNWSVVAKYGHEYAYNTTVIFEVQKYVLPTFSCKIEGTEGQDGKSLPQFVLLKDKTTIRGRIVAQYSHGKFVKGSALVRIGITKGDDTLVYRQIKLPLHQGGGQPFVFDTDDIIKQIPGDFKSHVIGEGIHIEADCYEWGTAMHMKDVNSQIIFTDTPFKFDFEKTKKYFKPGMPLVFQFALAYVNGRPAPGKEVKVTATATLKDGNTRSLKIETGAGGGDYITTREHGRGRMVYSTETHMVSVAVEFEVKYDDQNIKAKETYVLQKYDAVKDISVKIADKIFRKGDNLEIDVFFKGAVFTELTVLILARGQIVYAEKPKDHQWEVNAIINIPLDSRMIPSARVFVFFNQDGVVGGDSLWIDLEDSCADNDVVSVSTSKEKYIHNGRNKEGTLMLQGSPGSNVLVQMVDHAVLILNGRVTLNKDRMFQQLDDLDLGCGGGGGKSSSETFQMAGLSVATSLNQNNDNQPLDTGFRMLETCDAYNHGRNKRSLQDVRMSNLSYCCQMGEDAGTKVDLATTCRSQLNIFLWSHSPTPECAKNYKHCCQNITGEDEDKDDTIESAGRSSTKSTKEILDLAPSKIGVRRKFPESRIFDVLKLDENGFLNHDFTIPDSITTWSVEAVQLSQSGFCVADTHDFVVWKDVFLKINLPYHAVKGEHIMATATMYNYGTIGLTGHFYMKGINGICSNAPHDEYTDVQERTVTPEIPATVSWPIVPTEAGKYLIMFYVMNGADNEPLDIVEKTLTVVHEGIKSGTTISYAMDPTKDSHSRGCNKDGNILKCYTELILPRSSVPGSATAIVSVTGNLFGPAVTIVADPNAIQKHMREPAGCGEQVMIRVGPGVYAYSYMNSHTVPLQVEKDFPGYVKRGVNAISQYRKPLGGFGVWTKTPESTWLTSFVLKVFARANQLSPGAVDEKGFLESAVTFLYSKQTRNGDNKGKFLEHTSVARHHGEMIGAVKDSDLTLTSHVLISLMESKTSNKLHIDQHADTVNYLAKNVKETTSTYEKALVAYALALSDNPYRIIAYKRLQADAKEELQKDAKVRYFPERSPKIQVETAAYAVLAALQHQDWDYCYDIVIWLHTQRRANKMFQTTQDTVVALQALAEYAVKTRRDTNNLRIKLKNDDNEILEEYHYTNDNVDMEFNYRIPAQTINVGKTLVIEATGNGQAQVSTEILYNVYRKTTCSFDITLDLETENVEEEDNNARIGNGGPGEDDENAEKKRMHLEICVAYTKEGATEMAIIEVGMLTGYEPETDSLDILKLDDTVEVDEYEAGPGIAILYVKKIDESEKCYQFSAIQENTKIGAISPASVKVYDYYNPDEECSILYTEEDKDDWRINYDTHDNVCYEGICGSCYGRAKGYKRPKSLQQFKNVICSPSVSYVLKLEYIDTDYISDPEGNWMYYNMKVDHVMKLGEYNVKAGEHVRLAKRNQCTCPDLDAPVRKGAKYFLLYGKVEEITDLDNGESIYQLILNRDSYIEPWKFHKRGPHRALRKFLSEGCKV